MDGPTYMQKRRRKYLAQTLEAFEQLIEPNLPADASGSTAEFKGLVRAKFNALAVDASDLMTLSHNPEINGFAVELTDRLFPNGRPRSEQRS